jgi:hypothetical protein
MCVISDEEKASGEGHSEDAGSSQGSLRRLRARGTPQRHLSLQVEKRRR